MTTVTVFALATVSISGNGIVSLTLEPGTGCQALVSRGAAGMIASAIRSIFERPDEHAASEHLRRVAHGLVGQFPAVAGC